MTEISSKLKMWVMQDDRIYASQILPKCGAQGSTIKIRMFISGLLNKYKIHLQKYQVIFINPHLSGA